jgi:hypothetical protein
MLCVYFVWAFTCVSTNGFLGETPFGALRNQNRGSPAGRAAQRAVRAHAAAGARTAPPSLRPCVAVALRTAQWCAGRPSYKRAPWRV